ncbi:hypothetical protein [Paenibacillus periandrae]|uniref:hypothetical protein n=1 Tax=Paenibacillus periandrae TaxID=1761741 RepID=UPI001F08FB6C|nr:hypothetical protein [Paenibacillus periandrae]
MNVPAFPWGWKAGILEIDRTELIGLIPVFIKPHSLYFLRIAAAHVLGSSVSGLMQSIAVRWQQRMD